ERLTYIVLLVTKQSSPWLSLGDEADPRRLRESHDPVAMPAQQLIMRAGLPQPLRSVLPDRLQHPEAWLRTIMVERAARFAHQPLQRIDHPVSLACDHLRGIEREPAREDGQPLEQRLLVGCQEIVAPVQGSPQRPLSSRTRAPALRQEP